MHLFQCGYVDSVDTYLRACKKSYKRRGATTLPNALYLYESQFEAQAFQVKYSKAIAL